MADLVQSIQTIFSGNGAWLVVAVIAILATLGIKLLVRIISTRLRRLVGSTRSAWDDIGVDILERLKLWVVFVWVFYVMTKSLQPTESVRKVLLLVVVTSSVYQVVVWGLHLLQIWQRAVLGKRIQQDPSSAAALGLLSTLIRGAFVAIVILIGMSNLGVDITALLAGLGIGGVAIALAAQNVLGDLLASLSIVLDKPFVIGDFIVAGPEKGTVEHIGIKTTRLRSLSGEELVLSNKDLLESRIQNFKRMWQRRVTQQFGVLYSTPAEVLERIPVWVKEIVEKNEKLKFDRCHFFSYGASSLDFELVFFVTDSDYNVFMDLQQNVLLDIFRKFAREKVGFAFPTQSIYVEQIPTMTSQQAQIAQMAQIKPN